MMLSTYCLLMALCSVLAIKSVVPTSGHMLKGFPMQRVPLPTKLSGIRRLKSLDTAMDLKGGYSSSSFSKLARSLASAAADPTISGGVLSGGLHAITGPDHLAALIPPSIGRSGWNGLQIGCIWGLGHGLTAITIGMGAYFMKDKLLQGKFRLLNRLSELTEVAVGFSLLIIGVMGLKESLEALRGPSPAAVRSTADSDAAAQALGTNESDPRRGGSRRALFLNGILHGMSLDGAPSLTPALSSKTWRGAALFLTAYCLGTMLAMSLAAAAAGELSMRAGQVASSNNPDLSRQLSLASSCVAIAVGTYWIVQSVVLR